MKQSAVDYLQDEILQDRMIKAKSIKEWNDVINNAREMEKQQIIDACYGYQLYLAREFRFQQGGQAKILTFDQWYETYGSKGSDDTKTN